MKRIFTPLLALAIGFSSPQMASAQNGLPLDRYYSAREGTTWISTQEIKITSDVTFLASYQRGYQNKPVVGLRFVRLMLTTPKEKPIWADLEKGDCFISYGGKRLVVEANHYRTGENDSEDMVSLLVPVTAFREAVGAGKFFISVENTGYPVYGSIFSGLREMVSSMGAGSSQSIVARQAAQSTPKSVRLSARARRAAQNSIRALKRLESAIDGGVNYYGYSRYIVETQITLDQYLPAIPQGQVRSLLSKSLSAHKAARQSWKAMSGDSSSDIFEALRNSLIRGAVSDRINAENLLK